MVSVEEISEFKKEHLALEERIKKFEKKQYNTILELSEQLNELIYGIETVQDKGKSMKNPAVSTRIKMAKKGMKLSKGLKHFEKEVVFAFDEGRISEETGKRFGSILKSIKKNKMDLAKEEFEYFLEILDLDKRYNESIEELDEKNKTLEKEKLRIKNLLTEMSELEKETVDAEKVRNHEEFSESLKKLEGIRRNYLNSLVSKPVLELLDNLERHPMKDNFHSSPEKEAELKKFFLDYPDFGKYDAKQLCEISEYSEKKLSHICPETSRFRKLVLGNREFFNSINTLEQTSFLEVNENNENAMGFYAKNLDAKNIVEKILLLKKDKHSYREEYERDRKIKERKKELEKYSRKELEKELNDIESLIGLLHSDSIPESKEEHAGESLFSRIKSFFQ